MFEQKLTVYSPFSEKSSATKSFAAELLFHIGSYSVGHPIPYQNSHGIYAAATASSTAGSIFATLIFFPHTRFKPTQNISMDPTSDR